MKPIRVGLCLLFLTAWILACSSKAEPTGTLDLPVWAAPAEIHQPATTIQAPEEQVVGDLGWKSIGGVVYIIRAGSSRPAADAEVILRHHSIVHPPGIELSTRTAPDGSYEFPELFIHDTDVLILRAQLEDQYPVELRLDGQEAFYRTSIDLSLESP